MIGVIEIGIVVQQGRLGSFFHINYATNDFFNSLLQSRSVEPIKNGSDRFSQNSIMLLCTLGLVVWLAVSVSALISQLLYTRVLFFKFFCDHEVVGFI